MDPEVKEAFDEQNSLRHLTAEEWDYIDSALRLRAAVSVAEQWPARDRWPEDKTKTLCQNQEATHRGRVRRAVFRGGEVMDLWAALCRARFSVIEALGIAVAASLWTAGRFWTAILVVVGAVLVNGLSSLVLKGEAE